MGREETNIGIKSNETILLAQHLISRLLLLKRSPIDGSVYQQFWDQTIS